MPAPKERRQNSGAATFMLVEEQNAERKQIRKAILCPQARGKLAVIALFLPAPPCAWSAALPGVYLIELSVYVSVTPLGSKFP